ncbi:redox-sensitive bicupin YhaK (pirin superfamily) [Bradyrhizobium elkanii]|uniref:pirin family protein n=1 Tax=Bradyrhizobium elkanii TaxID=29448 RepID=UPI0021672509|nr:pirin family protein [Bradyrhizobium elkanii]MCS3479334.1 redox-sensitive bicupin YhaK (pirin superfamily) [Bradyrhizobium elkanii]
MNTVTLVRARKISSLHAAFHTLEGDGLEVRRAIPSPAFDAIGPFIFLDHFGPIEVRPGEAKGASAHPHAGVETLSLLLEGRTVHKDSLGNISAMGPGEVQWMRAGRGIIHDESPDEVLVRSGGRLHGIQLWINMPKGAKHTDPVYTHVNADEIPLLPHETGTVRLVAGRIGDVTGPVQTSGDPFVVHASLMSGDTLRLDATNPRELALYIMTGNVVIGGQAVEPGQLARLTSGDALDVMAKENSELLLIGGDPLDAPIVRHGPFVMNTIAELERAARDYHAGRMGQI